MSEDDVWSAEAASLDEDFGPCDYDDERIAEVIKIDHFVIWGLRALQNAPVPMIIAGFAVWAVGLVAGIVAQLANIGGTVAGSVSSSDPMVQQAISTLSQSTVQLMAAPFLWVATAAVATAAAKVIAYGETEWSAAIPSASSVLAVVVAQVLMAVAIQVPLLLVMALGGTAGFFAGGSDSDMQILLALGGLFAALLVCMPPLLYLGLRLAFVVPAAIVEGSGVQAFAASWRITRGMAILHVFLFMLVEVGLGLVNVLACCLFGLPSVVIVPFTQAAFTAVYLRATRTDETLAPGGFFEDM